MFDRIQAWLLHIAGQVVTMPLYGAAPIITLVGWEFPPVRDFLFSWVTPALHLITK